MSIFLYEKRNHRDDIQLNNIDDFHNNYHKHRTMTNFVYFHISQKVDMLLDVKTRHSKYRRVSYILIIFAEYLF